MDASGQSEGRKGEGQTKSFENHLYKTTEEQPRQRAMSTYGSRPDGLRGGPRAAAPPAPWPDLPTTDISRVQRSTVGRSRLSWSNGKDCAGHGAREALTNARDAAETVPGADVLNRSTRCERGAMTDRAGCGRTRLREPSRDARRRGAGEVTVRCPSRGKNNNIYNGAALCAGPVETGQGDATLGSGHGFAPGRFAGRCRGLRSHTRGLSLQASRLAHRNVKRAGSWSDGTDLGLQPGAAMACRGEPGAGQKVCGRRQRYGTIGRWR